VIRGKRSAFFETPDNFFPSPVGHTIGHTSHQKDARAFLCVGYSHPTWRTPKPLYALAAPIFFFPFPSSPHRYLSSAQYWFEVGCGRIFVSAVWNSGP
jgi:hypothetical protein